MTNEPPQKRQRVEPEHLDELSFLASPPAGTIQRSELIWRPYGDIVLQAESTQFRVNRDILALQSSVFRDMFLLPQPADPPMVDGCPLVFLPGDSAEDWECLLDLLYDPYTGRDDFSLFGIEVMLKLGRKYDMANIRRHAIFCIHSDFPSLKSNFDSVRRSGNSPKIGKEVGMEVVLLSLAETHGINKCIPTLALKCLKKYSIETLINDGVRRRTSGTPIVLQTQLKFMLSIAAERITEWQRKAFAWLELDNESVIPVQNCGAGDCGLDRGKIHRLVMRGRAGKRYMVLETWDALACNNYVCAPCLRAAESRWRIDRVTAWESLPSWFGLPSWEDILREDNEG
ncbi:BTB domain-containing protein [Mycena chlorophos]|uniref:BTB domain-containing protein n=1 Tax=Mycena chlorophos TaxID=658473 RepID=A0A8H6WIZ2_MYCCL|nr:BTB domain-containing protein [Mycena chlorophos]